MQETKKLKTERKTLSTIDKVPSPKELYSELTTAEGWPYKINQEFYLARDRALVSLMYLLACRVSEAIQLKRSQFKQVNNHLAVESIILSKRKPGKIKYREGMLPLKGVRAVFTLLVIHYFDLLKIENPNQDRLFTFSLERKQYGNSVRLVGTRRAWEVMKALLPNITDHWLRAFGDDYLYDIWDHDIMAVSDYTKQDARTLQLYLRKRYKKYHAG
jgi:integrase